MQRTKGQSGEREVAAIVRDLTGWDVRRRVRQHDGDSDLVGVPGWAIEVKRQKAAPRGQIRAWWRQAVEQATRVATQAENGATADLARPVLFFRADRDEWRAVWSLGPEMAGESPWMDYGWTVEGSVEAWAAVASPAHGLRAEPA